MRIAIIALFLTLMLQQAEILYFNRERVKEIESIVNSQFKFNKAQLEFDLAIVGGDKK
jgi:hypothetical protein